MGIDKHISSLTHPEAPKVTRKLPSFCRDSLITLIREWVTTEQIKRANRHNNDEAYDINIGYLLCLSNLMELLIEIENNIKCSYEIPK
jgi:hypothetical protein